MSLSDLEQPLPRFATFGAALCSAALLFLAMPGRFSWWPLIFVALVPLLLALPGLSLRRAACMGFFCGLVYHISTMYWIVIVMGRYGGLPPWIAVAGMTLLASYMAGYFAVFCLLLSRLFITRNQGGVSGRLLLAAPLFWVGLEYLRGVALTGLPWMDLGYGLYLHPLFIQVADLGGQPLVSFSVVLVNALAAVALRRVFPVAGKSGQHNLPAEATALIILATLGLYSEMRYQQVLTTMQSAEQVTVAAIQGNISQDEKWTRQKKEETVTRYLALSKEVVLANTNKPELIIWPETALPFFPQQEQKLMARVVDFIREQQVGLLTGAPVYEMHPVSQVEVAQRRIDLYNSALLLDEQGRLAGRYDKHHLVPFGEYVPLRRVLFFLEPLVESVGNFTSGSRFAPVTLGKIRAGVLICFESIFPGIARQEVASGSNLLVNMTNDAWYGRTSAPHQSLAMAVFRAVENRRSLVRAANTGISSVVDSAGRIRSRSALFVTAAIRSPVELLTSLTIFTRWGYVFGQVCFVLMFPLFLFWRIKKDELTKGQTPC